jgi:hypothetical protein
MTLSWIVQWAIPQPGINKPSPITMRLQYYNHSWSCWQILASDQWLDESKLALSTPLRSIDPVWNSMHLLERCPLQLKGRRLKNLKARNTEQ